MGVRRPGVTRACVRRVPINVHKCDVATSECDFHWAWEATLRELEMGSRAVGQWVASLSCATQYRDAQRFAILPDSNTIVLLYDYTISVSLM